MHKSTVLPILTQMIDECTERQAKLFACACCRRLWDRLPDSGRRMIQVVESFIDGNATETQVLEHERVMGSTWAELVKQEGQGVFHGGSHHMHQSLEEAVFAVWTLTSIRNRPRVRSIVSRVIHAVGFSTGADYTGPRSEERHAAEIREEESLRDILQDILGKENLGPWKSANVMGVAAALYNERSNHGYLDPVGVSVLADALEDANCPGDHVVLTHLRGPGSHVRGCWVIESILGRK